MGTDYRLVKKGMREPREGLIAQGHYSLALAIRHETELAQHGWFPTDTERLRTNLAFLESAVAKQADERGIAREKTREQEAAVDDAKVFIRRLRYALPKVLRNTSTPNVSHESFATMGTLGRSPALIAAYLTRITPAVERLDAELAPFFGGARPAEILADVRTRLVEANTEQELQLASLPAETLRVYEAKGRLLEDIEDLNRAGRSAFDGNAEMAAPFNKDLILRERKKRRTKSEVVPIAKAGCETDKAENS